MEKTVGKDNKSNSCFQTPKTQNYFLHSVLCARRAVGAVAQQNAVSVPSEHLFTTKSERRLKWEAGCSEQCQPSSLAAHIPSPSCLEMPECGQEPLWACVLLQQIHSVSEAATEWVKVVFRLLTAVWGEKCFLTEVETAEFFPVFCFMSYVSWSWGATRKEQPRGCTCFFGV